MSEPRSDELHGTVAFSPPAESSQGPGQQAPPQGEDSSAIPSRLGRYRVTAKLGAGAFGVVYQGCDDELRRDVAIKVPHRHRVAAPQQAEAYLAEARILAQLDHPGIVPVYDVGRTEDGLCYLVSKLVEGTDLAARIGQQARQSPAEATAIIAQAAEALHHAHQRGLVHRDIKPANILLDKDNRPIVADFGLALREEDFGKGAAFVGSPAYMSPEQARSEGHRVDARTDVYSLGVVFYELLTGRRPFAADSLCDLLDQIATLEPRPPRQLDTTVPKELDRICLKALNKRAADRYSTAIDLAEDLRYWLAQQVQPSSARSAADGASAGAVASVPSPPAVAADSDKRPIKIVPKGLRSFDAGDADFFLELLPGPRDRDGLPESIRFWKTRIETSDPDQGFNVGLIYGPSGCGKSSLVKAGLLPRLADHVLPAYIEATSDDTEARLLKGLRRRCPQLPDNLGLVETLAHLRRKPVSSRNRVSDATQKVLIVLDQFEQWLHARREEQNTELVQALRQCDGQHVQCVVMVRDDFWMAATRFLRDLEVPLVEGQNSAAVDLFDPRHARKVLAAFGKAFDCLPADADKLTTDQDRFLDQAVAELAQDGKVISVRLNLFVEMVKGRSWRPDTLKEVGGMEGVGLTFLEETFSAKTAPPEHRLHQKAAQAILKALLPETGTDIKGHMRSYAELRVASGCLRGPEPFDDVLRILDAKLRLVTPADAEGLQIDEPVRILAKHDEKYYQLTHDYLVPALREWLLRKQQQTMHGRAQLVLGERAALWGPRQESRQLPSFEEWLRINLFTRKAEWSEIQRHMMQKAKWNHLPQAVLWIFLTLQVLFVCLLALLHYANEQLALGLFQEVDSLFFYRFAVLGLYGLMICCTLYVVIRVTLWLSSKLLLGIKSLVVGTERKLRRVH